jgi:hypothetical protein
LFGCLLFLCCANSVSALCKFPRTYARTHANDTDPQGYTGYQKPSRGPTPTTDPATTTTQHTKASGHICIPTRSKGRRHQLVVDIKLNTSSLSSLKALVRRRMAVSSAVFNSSTQHANQLISIKPTTTTQPSPTARWQHTTFPRSMT